MSKQDELSEKFAELESKFAKLEKQSLIMFEALLAVERNEWKSGPVTIKGSADTLMDVASDAIEKVGKVGAE